MFISAVIGGLGSLGGALLGALYLRGVRWFITVEEWQLLTTGLGVLVVLLVLPGGIGGLWVKLRDVVVRLLDPWRRDAAAAAAAPAALAAAEPSRRSSWPTVLGPTSSTTRWPRRSTARREARSAGRREPLLRRRRATR